MSQQRCPLLKPFFSHGGMQSLLSGGRVQVHLTQEPLPPPSDRSVRVGDRNVRTTAAQGVNGQRKAPDTRSSTRSTMLTAFSQAAGAPQASVRHPPSCSPTAAPPTPTRSSGRVVVRSFNAPGVKRHQHQRHHNRRTCMTMRALSPWDTLRSTFKLPDWSGASSSAAAEKQATDALLLLLQGTERGLNSSPAARAEIEAVVDTLAGLQAGKVTTDQALSATWELTWTTEKETLWIVRNAGLFGTTAGGVYQVIDVDAGTLQNVIEFPPEGAFVVNSSISVESEQRVSFQFTAATLKLPGGRDVRLPPFGKGWFDTVFIGPEIRVARDIRGDVLVCRRAGPPRTF